jgi:hypothetical protein
MVFSSKKRDFFFLPIFYSITLQQKIQRFAIKKEKESARERFLSEALPGRSLFRRSARRPQRLTDY